VNEVLRNIGRALNYFFAEVAEQSAALDVIDHGDEDAGAKYRMFDPRMRSVENFDILTEIAPAEFWLSIEEKALT
jgi:hypothetical protein